MTALRGIGSVELGVDGQSRGHSVTRIPLIYFASAKGLVAIPTTAAKPREALERYLAGPPAPDLTGLPPDVQLLAHEYDSADGLLTLKFSYTPSLRAAAIERPERMRTVLLGLIATLTEFPEVRAVQLDFGGQTRLGLGQCIEHNSVMRPLRHLESMGVELTVVRSGRDGTLDINRLNDVLHPGTRLLVTTHGSNVTGALVPIRAAASLARSRGILYLVDAAQTAGSVPIDILKTDVDLIAFSGHKGLLGPTGTGGLYIREGVPLEPLMRGGTGSDSAYETQPGFFPDMHESGTLNVAGIAGLGAGIRFLQDIRVETVRAHEQKLVSQFTAGAREISGLTIYGPRDAALQCGVVSFNIDGAMPSEVGLILDEQFEIMARTRHTASAWPATRGIL